MYIYIYASVAKQTNKPHAPQSAKGAAPVPPRPPGLDIPLHRGAPASAAVFFLPALVSVPLPLRVGRLQQLPVRRASMSFFRQPRKKGKKTKNDVFFQYSTRLHMHAAVLLLLLYSSSSIGFFPKQQLVVVQSVPYSSEKSKRLVLRETNAELN